MEHVFGGSWTEEKLARLRSYLIAYRAIFAKNKNAQHYKTWYVDAFAGTGSRSQTIQSSKYSFIASEEEVDEEATKFLDGSAKIALGLESPFDRYLFIEGSKKKADELKRVVDLEFPTLRGVVEIKQEDANEALCEWCRERDWTKERAVVFLDPYGMQVEWNTVAALGATGGVDLWYLFPLLNRLLRHDGVIDPKWANRLTTLLGTDDWANHFYSTKVEETLFGIQESIKRDATVSKVQEFIEERLRSCYVSVAKSYILKNSKSSPLFALCFAVSNQKGAKPALKIAQHILRN